MACDGDILGGFPGKLQQKRAICALLLLACVALVLMVLPYGHGGGAMAPDRLLLPHPVVLA